MSNQKKIFLGMLILTTFLTIYLIKDYLGVIALAILVVLMFNPVYKKILFWTKGKNSISITITLLVIFLCLIIPIALIGSLTAYQVSEMANDLSDIDFKSSDIGTITNDTLHTINDKLKSYSINYEITVDQVNSTLTNALRSGGGILLDFGKNIGSKIPDLFGQLILFLVFLTFLFSNQDKILKIIRKISPLTEENNQIYLSRMAAMARSMINGTFVVAFVQAVMSAITLWLLGVPYVLFLFFLLLIASIIPLLGSGLILIPVSLIMIATGNVIGGIIVIVVQFLVISNVDNVLRPKLVEEDARLPEAITLLGIIAGMSMFGVLGLIFGPIIMVVAYTTYDIYLKYYAIPIKNFLNQDN